MRNRNPAKNFINSTSPISFYSPEIPPTCIFIAGLIILSILTWLFLRGNSQDWRIIYWLVFFWILLIGIGIYIIRKALRHKKAKEEKQNAAIQPIAKIFKKITDIFLSMSNKIQFTHSPWFIINEKFEKTTKFSIHFWESIYVNEELIIKWWSNIHFKNRQTLIQSALDAYESVEFASSIKILHSQIRNIINEWLAIYLYNDHEIENQFELIFSSISPLTDVFMCGLTFLLADTIYYIISNPITR